MTEVTMQDEVAVASKTNLPKRVAAVLQIVTPEGEVLKAIKYPMPLKAPRFNLLINDQECEAACTTFGTIKYTYFMFNGASFYVPGHLDQEPAYTFSFPENYKFEPLKLDRKAQSEVAAKAKAAKAPAVAGAGEESPLGSSETGGEGEGSPEASDAPTTPQAGGKKGKKAHR